MNVRLPATAAALAASVVLMWATASAQCRAPHFYLGADYGNLVQVSLAKRDLTVDKIVCLGQTLKERRRSGGVYSLHLLLVFSTHEAAKYFRSYVEDRPVGWDVWARALRALYSVDGDKHEESLDLTPTGYSTALGLGTTIRLPRTAALVCNWQIQNRCVMGVEPFPYPVEALRARAAGLIVLQGTVKPDGGVAAIRAVSVDVTPREAGKQLLEAAMGHLKSWRFDAAEHDDEIEVTYSFLFDPSVSPLSPTEDDWIPPNHVIVRFNPGE